MSGKIVNLRMARKRRLREEQSESATENAARHGVPKALKSLEAARAEKAQRDLEGKKRE